MRKFAAVPTATIIGCLLITSCSAAGDAKRDTDHLENTICDTSVTTSALRNIYPGPYTSTKMMPSKGGGIDALGRTGGATEGDCDIWITQKNGDVFSVVKVATSIEADTRAEDLFKNYKRYYPDNRRKITLGPATGFTTPEKSVLVFDCRSPKGRAAQNGGFGVSVQVLLPNRRKGSDVPSERLAEGAAKLAADTARYVSSEVLKCSAPRLPGGAPVRKSAALTKS